jgi:hypothetical protein
MNWNWAMEPNAVSQILEFGAWAFTQHSAAREKVPHTTSEVDGERHDQVTAQRSNAQQEPHH